LIELSGFIKWINKNIKDEGEGEGWEMPRGVNNAEQPEAPAKVK
jgi:hypothetical protein